MKVANPLTRVLLLISLFVSVTTVSAQQFRAPTTDRLPPPTSEKADSQEDEEEFIEPSRPGVANSAEFQKAGVLQVEFGYDGNFRGTEFQDEQTAPLTFRFAASKRLLVEAQFDSVISQKDSAGDRATGIGDTRLGFQVVALTDSPAHPALAFAYYAKLPTADQNRELGTGRVDHKILMLVSKKLGAVDMDLNAAYLIVGREGERGWVTGGQGAVSFAGEWENGFGLHGELYGQTKDDVQPKGLFALGALRYKVNRRLSLDAGMRVGINPDAPRFGIFTGLTVGVADLYKSQ